jgi:CubicO group peptidase (beta-lactamase class C family)
MLERAKADQLVYGPDTNWNYSNIGYFFVHQIVEQTTDDPLDQVLERRILQPAKAVDRAASLPSPTAAAGPQPSSVAMKS